MSANRKSALRPAHVVIIIAALLLLFLLLPWFCGPGPGNEQAPRARCMSNLKQLGLGMRLYALDFNESMPWGDGSIEPSCRYEGMLCPTYVSAIEVFHCPSSGDDFIDRDSETAVGEFASFSYEAVSKGLSYSYGHDHDKPWTEAAPLSTRLAADKYANADYTRGDLKHKPGNHAGDGRNVVLLDGSAIWDNERGLLEADPETGIADDSDPEHDQTGPDWWSDPPEK